MSDTLTKIREKYPAYAEIPDEKLVEAIGVKYPQYLEQDKSFAGEYDKYVEGPQRTSQAESLGAIPGGAPAIPAAAPTQYPPGSPMAIMEKQVKDIYAPLVEVSKHMPSAKEVSDALDVLAAIAPEPEPSGTPNLTPEMRQEMLTAPSQVGAASKVAAGTLRAIASVPEFLTTPHGAATLAMGGAPAIAQRAVAGTFAVEMAKNLPAQAEAVAKAIQEGDPEKIAETTTGLALSSGFLAGTAHQALRSTPLTSAQVEGRTVEILPEAKVAAENNAPATATAVQQANEILKPKGGEENAISKPETTQLYGNVQQPEVAPKVTGEVPANVSGEGIPARGSTQETPSGIAGEVKGGEINAKEEKVKVQEGVKEGLLAGAGPGGTIPSDVGVGPDLPQLTESLKGVSSSKVPFLQKLKQGSGIAQTLDQVKSAATQAVEGVKGAAAVIWDKLSKPPEVTDWTKSVGEWNFEDQQSSFYARKFIKQIRKSIPDVRRREAINNWIDTAGDPAMLDQAAAETKPEYRKGYEDAKNLTPDELVVAKNVQNYFESMLDKAIDEGLFEQGVENYIHRIYKNDEPAVRAYVQELRGLQTNPALAKKRFYQFDFEAEKAGKRPVKDFAERLAAYDQSFNRAVAARAFVKSVRDLKMEDGRPMVDVDGVGIPVEAPKDVSLIKASAKPNSKEPIDNRADYIEYDHPAFRKWKWTTSDTEGNPVMLQGNMLVHPDAINKFKALLDKSWWSKGSIRRAALGLSSIIKQTKFSLSAFHPVQIATHAAEHREVPFKTVQIDLNDPRQANLVRGGLVIAETGHMQSFSEGLSGSALTEKIPYIGPKLHAFNEWLFQDFIPRTKMTMALDALTRNEQRFAKELKSGKVTQDQIYRLTAEQGNAAFGEQNYKMLGRHPTYQDTLRVLLLAPDFLEARSRFVGQAMTKYGTEQRVALLLGAAAIYTIGRLMNKALEGEWHWDHPFSVIYKGREYNLRTVQEDLWRLVTDPGRFAEHRMNPLYARTAKEFLSGRDWRGEKRDYLQQAEDLAKTVVPISVSPKDGDEWWHSLLSGMGVSSRQFSRQTEIRKLADDFLKKKGMAPEAETIQSADAPYRKLKIALRADDEKAALEMIQELRKTRKDSLIHESMQRGRDMPFTGNKKREKEFRTGLDEEQKRAYLQAMEERRDIYQRFLKAWQNRGPRKESK